MKISFVLSALLAAAPCVAVAQEPVPVVRSMSVAELETCAKRAWSLNGEVAELKTIDEAIQNRGLALKSESAAIDGLRQRLNLRDPKSVAAFNARLNRSNAAIANYRRELDARNGVSKVVKQHETEFNVLCTGRPYNTDDLAKVAEPGRSAMAAHSHATTVPVVDTIMPSAGTQGAAPMLITGPAPRPASDLIADLRKAADGGDAKSQYLFAQRLYFGKDVPRDPGKALEYYLKAADQGNADAAFSVSRLLTEGVDVSADSERATAYLRKAADAGNHDAEHNLALWYENKSCDRDRHAQALAWMTKAAISGDPESQMVLAQFYAEGTGTRRDPAAAPGWMVKSANQGFRPAQLELGERLRDGKGVERNPADALKWLLLAAGMTKQDASAGCTRLMMQSSVTRQRAQDAAKAIQKELSPADADRAQAAANDWVTTFRAKAVGGC